MPKGVFQGNGMGANTQLLRKVKVQVHDYPVSKRTLLQALWQLRGVTKKVVPNQLSQRVTMLGHKMKCYMYYDQKKILTAMLKEY